MKELRITAEMLDKHLGGAEDPNEQRITQTHVAAAVRARPLISCTGLVEPAAVIRLEIKYDLKGQEGTGFEQARK